MMVLSSSSVHFSFTISGLRWLCHLSLHCLPILPGRCFAIKLQFFGPWLLTSLSTSSSYSKVYIKKVKPKVPWWGKDWAPFASGVGIGHQSYLLRKRQFFSNCELHTIRQVFLVFHLLVESTNVFGWWRAWWAEVNSKIKFVDMRTLGLSGLMMVTHPVNLKGSQSWWKCCYFWVEPCHCRRVCADLNSREALTRLITTITANLLLRNQS